MIPESARNASHLANHASKKSLSLAKRKCRRRDPSGEQGWILLLVQLVSHGDVFFLVGRVVVGVAAPRAPCGPSSSSRSLHASRSFVLLAVRCLRPPVPNGLSLEYLGRPWPDWDVLHLHAIGPTCSIHVWPRVWPPRSDASDIASCPSSRSFALLAVHCAPCSSRYAAAVPNGLNLDSLFIIEPGFAHNISHNRYFSYHPNCILQESLAPNRRKK